MAITKSSKKTENARRRLLKSLMIGGGAVTASKLMPEHWTRPTVASVMLPAHALTTTDTRLNCATGTTSFPINETLTNNFAGTLSNTIFMGLIIDGSFTVTATLDNISTPCDGSQAITFIGSTVGSFYGTQSLYCDGSLAGYCMGTGNVSGDSTYITLDGSAFCTACTYLIATTGP